jgi:hypothetical protein
MECNVKEATNQGKRGGEIQCHTCSRDDTSAVDENLSVGVKISSWWGSVTATSTSAAVRVNFFRTEDIGDNAGDADSRCVPFVPFVLAISHAAVLPPPPPPALRRPVQSETRGGGAPLRLVVVGELAVADPAVSLVAARTRLQADR